MQNTHHTHRSQDKKLINLLLSDKKYPPIVQSRENPPTTHNHIYHNAQDVTKKN